MLNPDDQEALARRLGMKTREIIDATELSADPPAVLVRTHDGQQVLVTADAVAPWTGSLPGAAPVPAPAADEPAAELEGSDDDPDEVPAGTADEVLAWVGEDRDRATRALQAEQGRDKPRSTLSAQLEKLAGLA